jgi:hypothetical protein
MPQNKKRPSAAKRTPTKPAVPKPRQTSKWLLIICLLAIAGLVVWRLYFVEKPSFCYVDSGTLACADTSGQHLRHFQLPQPGGHEITGLLPAPDQSRYVAIISNITGLDNYAPTIWLLHKDLSTDKQIDLHEVRNDGDTSGRLFAVWSPDSQNLLIHSSQGMDRLYDYTLTTSKLTQIGDFFSEGLGVGYYGFAGNDRVVAVSGTDSAWSKVTTYKPDGSDEQAIATNDGIYSGSYAATRQGYIIYHKGTALYAIRSDGSGFKQLAAKADFSYIKYDQRSNMLYLIKKRQNSQGWTTGVSSVASISVNDLLNGGQPKTVSLHNDIQAEDKAYVTATDSQHLLLNGMFGSAVYNLRSGKAVKLAAGPLVMPGDSATDIEGVAGTVATTKLFKPAPATANDRIRDLAKAPTGLQAVLLAEFKQQAAACAQKPDRYGSRLDMRFAAADADTAAVQVSCRVTGYWGKSGRLTFYRRQAGSWQAIRSDTAGYGWPSCDFVAQYHISRQLSAKCDTNSSGVFIDNPN